MDDLLNVHRKSFLIYLLYLEKYYEKKFCRLSASNYIYIRIYNYLDSFC